MYDRRLDGFVKTVELGSFAKAGEALFVSGNAVAKQVDGLEAELGAQLVVRTNHGVEPTRAGRILYEGAGAVIALSNRLVKNVQAAAGEERRIVRLAASQMRPPTHVGRWWSTVAGNHPGVELQIVQVSDDERVWDSIFLNLGEAADVLLSIEPADVHAGARLPYECRELFRSAMCIAVPLGHRLAIQHTVKLADLDNGNLFVQRRGSTNQVDRFIELIQSEHPSIHLIEVAPYEMEAYNAAARANAPILNCRDLGELHPGFVNIDCEWGDDFPLPFCLIYPRHPNPAVQEFVEAVSKRAAEEKAATKVE